jgi:hypothetical protein
VLIKSQPLKEIPYVTCYRIHQGSPSVQHPPHTDDFTPKTRKSTSLSQHRSDTDGNRADNRSEVDAWAADFREHYAVPDLTLVEFLVKYVPSNTPYPTIAPQCQARFVEFRQIKVKLACTTPW